MSWRHWILLLLVVGVIAAVFLFPAIPQNEAYHNFADKRGLWGVPNLLNVVSNGLFLIAGLMGVRFVGAKPPEDRATFSSPVERWAYLLFFISVAATAFGSAYYHWRPTDGTLLWDRLPLAVGFLSLLAGLVCERTAPKNAVIYLLLLPAWGAGSVFYWYDTQENGHGDLRPYIIAQFGSMLAILLLVALFPPRYTRTGDLAIALGFYALAKIFELGDQLIFSWGGIVSGHTLKHIAAAVSAYWILRMLQRRAPVAGGVSQPIG